MHKVLLSRQTKLAQTRGIRSNALRNGLAIPYPAFDDRYEFSLAWWSICCLIIGIIHIVVGIIFFTSGD